jgi:hypothetical protein
MVASAIVGGVSAQNAADAQKKAAEQASQAEMQMYQQTRSDLAPYRSFGASLVGPLQGLLAGDPGAQMAELSGLPGYQFTLNQGLQAAQDSAAARGLGSSGAALQGAANYAAGLADSTYGNQVNRLLQGAGMGQGAAAQTGGFGATAAGQVGQNDMAAGNAQAQADLAIGKAIEGYINPYMNSTNGPALANTLMNYMQAGHTGLFDPVSVPTGITSLLY